MLTIGALAGIKRSIKDIKSRIEMMENQVNSFKFDAKRIEDLLNKIESELNKK